MNGLEDRRLLSALGVPIPLQPLGPAEIALPEAGRTLPAVAPGAVAGLPVEWLARTIAGSLESQSLPSLTGATAPGNPLNLGQGRATQTESWLTSLPAGRVGSVSSALAPVLRPVSTLGSPINTLGLPAEVPLLRGTLAAVEDAVAQAAASAPALGASGLNDVLMAPSMLAELTAWRAADSSSVSSPAANSLGGASAAGGAAPGWGAAEQAVAERESAGAAAGEVEIAAASARAESPEAPAELAIDELDALEQALAQFLAQLAGPAERITLELSELDVLALAVGVLAGAAVAYRRLARGENGAEPQAAASRPAARWSPGVPVPFSLGHSPLCS